MPGRSTSSSAPGGLLARTHPAYEFRRGQLQMAEAVEQALEEKRHLIVEAGTGTGKTLAYLLPVIRSGKRVIISTGTKTLQEQLFYKDVPFLQAAPRRARVCYMKGRSNYLCRKKLYDLTDQPVLNGLEEIEQYRAISEWEKTTETGDRAELAGLPEASHAVAQARCAHRPLHRPEVPAVRPLLHHRDAAPGAESDIIIVNHHLFCADLAIKLAAEHAPDAGVLPDARVVIFDEAHELEDVAASYFGVSVSNLRVEELAARCREHAAPEPTCAVCRRAAGVEHVREHSQFFFALLPPGEGDSPSRVAASFWKRMVTNTGPAECADASLHRAAGHSQASRTKCTA